MGTFSLFFLLGLAATCKGDGDDSCLKDDVDMLQGRTRKSSKSDVPLERENLIVDNPEMYYEFGAEIRRDFISVTKRARNKRTGDDFEAIFCSYNDNGGEMLNICAREFDLYDSPAKGLKGVPQLHEAYIVRKYVILIVKVGFGAPKPILSFVSKKISILESDISNIIRSLVENLGEAHKKNIMNLGINPQTMVVNSASEVFFTSLHTAVNYKGRGSGQVADIITDTEFAAPECVGFDPMLPQTDMWGVGVLTYLLLTGESPFYYEDENKAVMSVQRVQYTMEAMSRTSRDAKDFVKKLLKRAPEARPTAEDLLQHPWLAGPSLHNQMLYIQDLLDETDFRLYGEAEEEAIYPALVLRTFEQEDYVGDYEY